MTHQSLQLDAFLADTHAQAQLLQTGECNESAHATMLNITEKLLHGEALPSLSYQNNHISAGCHRSNTVAVRIPGTSSCHAAIQWNIAHFLQLARMAVPNPQNAITACSCH